MSYANVSKKAAGEAAWIQFTLVAATCCSCFMGDPSSIPGSMLRFFGVVGRVAMTAQGSKFERGIGQI
jgi:hypothetical protein